jgi:hypothetical protein
MNTSSKKSFEPCNWPFNDGAEYNPCERLKIRGGYIYFRPQSEHFQFTVSCGPNSERSFSGCYFGHDGMTADKVRADLIRRSGSF